MISSVRAKLRLEGCCIYIPQALRVADPHRELMCGSVCHYLQELLQIAPTTGTNLGASCGRHIRFVVQRHPFYAPYISEAALLCVSDKQEMQSSMLADTNPQNPGAGCIVLELRSGEGNLVHRASQAATRHPLTHRDSLDSLGAGRGKPFAPMASRSCRERRSKKWGNGCR